LEHIKESHPHLYRAVKNPTAKARLGANVTTFRLKKGMTREQLAARVKIGHHALRKIEEAHPSSNPRLHVIESLAKVLKVDVLDLYRFIDLAESVVR
jgi:transcriptional regulator with XRE-family HTH domain